MNRSVPGRSNYFCHLNVVAIVFTLLVFKASAQDSNRRQATPEKYSSNKSILNLPVRGSPYPQDGRNQSWSSLRAVSTFYPIGECATYTYKLQVGNTNSNEFTNDLITASNGLTYLVGQSTVNGNPDATLQQIDKTGRVAWTKAIGVPGRSESINSIRKHVDGNLILIGTTMLPDNSDKKVFIAEADLNGNIQWLKTLSGITGYKGVAVISTNRQGIGFVADDDSTIVYGKMDNSGNLSWVRRLRPMNKGKALGIVKSNYDGWAIGYSGTDSARYAGMVIQVDLTGNVSWIDKLGGSSSDADFILHGVGINNGRPQLSGIYSEHNGPYQLCKLIINGPSSSQYNQTFSFPGQPISVSATSIISSNTQVIAFYPDITSTELFMFKPFNDATPDTLIHWRCVFSNMPASRLAAVNRTFDGGFMLSLDKKVTSANTDNYLIKVDSAGWLKGCEGADFSAVSKINYSYPILPVTIKPTVIAASLANENWPLQSVTPQTNFICRELACPVKPVEDSCLQTFIRKYRSYNFHDVGGSLVVTDKLEAIVAGATKDGFEEGDSSSSTMIKFDARGKLLERKKIVLGSSSGSFKLTTLKDGNFLSLGSSSFNDTSFITVSKYSNDMTLLWNRGFARYKMSYNLYDLVEGDDGSLFLFFREGPDVFDQKPRVIKLDKNGAFVWMKNYDINGSLYLDTGSMCQDQDYLYLTCYVLNGTGGGFIMKVDKVSGNPVWSNLYKIQGATNYHPTRDISILGNNLVVQGFVTMTGPSISAVVIVDKNGMVVNNKSMQSQGSGMGLKMVVTKNSDLVFSGLGIDNVPGGRNAYFNLFIRLDNQLNLLYSKKTASHSFITTSLINADNNAFYSTGVCNYGDIYSNDMFLKKTAYNGITGDCPPDSLVLTFGQSVYTVTNYPFNVTSGSVISHSLPYREDTYALQENTLMCSAAAACSSVKLTGKATICDTAVYTFKVVRTAGCSQPVNFVYDTSAIKKLRETDTTVEVQFFNKGLMKIRATLFNGCKFLSDSLEVNVDNVSAKLDLGPDKTLCTGNAIVLHAGGLFSSYRWQDGSLDSNLTVKVAGTYYVQAQAGCGTVLHDTINVKSAPPISFLAGIDRTKCNSDTLQLHAPPGFLNYSWSPDYQLSAANTSTAIANPQLDTSYYLQAQNSEGCFIYDTIAVRVNRSSLIDLGSDTSFCQGDSLNLKAPGGFKDYKWSDGNTLQQISVKAAGVYFVSATATNSCVSKDTLQVISVFKNPVAQLGNDSSLCLGSSRLLDAGNGFIHYLWNNGSTARTLAVYDSGNYTVSVTDQYGCKAKANLVINTLLPSPAAFLPPDTIICSNTFLIIKPLQAFKQYLWSTGNATSALKVFQKGIYYLEVQDDHNCKGKDTITVGTNNACLQGFYVPNAFTPNNNGKNDFFKPVLYGNITHYRFTIFNRWGQKVFSTTNPANGWDGKINGKDSPSATYIWTCQYQPEGGTVTLEKGTLMLVK